MILVSVKSEVVQDKRQFKSDAACMRFLKAIHRLHNSHRAKLIRPKPNRKDYSRKEFGRNRWRADLKQWNLDLGNQIALKVEIINTKYNQLGLHTQFKQA